MHASIGIPNGHGLLSPVIASIAMKGNHHDYKDKMICLNNATKQALQDWAILLQVANEHPTPCTDLVQALANYRGY